MTLITGVLLSTSNYTYDVLSVTADMSYTAVDNDLEATTSMQQYSKLESSTDTTTIFLGVTAKYTFDLAGVEVAPHACLRYTNIDLYDYSIKSNGATIADYRALIRSTSSPSLWV